MTLIELRRPVQEIRPRLLRKRAARPMLQAGCGQTPRVVITRREIILNLPFYFKSKN